MVWWLRTRFQNTVWEQVFESVCARKCDLRRAVARLLGGGALDFNADNLFEHGILLVRNITLMLWCFRFQLAWKKGFAKEVQKWYFSVIIASLVSNTFRGKSFLNQMENILKLSRKLVEEVNPYARILKMTFILWFSSSSTQILA